MSEDPAATAMVAAVAHVISSCASFVIGLILLFALKADL